MVFKIHANNSTMQITNQKSDQIPIKEFTPLSLCLKTSVFYHLKTRYCVNTEVKTLLIL